ncbi:CLIP domain-containing serine protease HP8 [Leptinotarsa decemlineata]|uniref:CLIP domain-containing serine protease HP8 n=1 Tax=Leptinotarsa decemlineata TaxID=7539 RepID=UPI003D304500
MGDTGLFRSVVILFGLFNVCYTQSYDSCFTPRNENGDCKVISSCPSLFALLEKRPIKSQDADYLRRSQCGFEGTLPKVCCPSGGQKSSTSKPVTDHNMELKPSKSSLLPSTEMCGISTQDKIYGGTEAGLQEFPWMALVEYERDDRRHGFYCGGVLINSRYILTAAHCIKGKDLPKTWKLVSVRLGEHNTDNETDCYDNGFTVQCSPPPINVPVEETVAHEQYDAYDVNQYHDIGLLRLAREVTFTANVKPICLPKTANDQTKSFVGKKLTVAGWGKTETRSESSVKLKLDVPVKANSECSRIYSQAGVNLQGSQVCAGGEKGKDSCRGDSGGPLMSLYADENGEINWYSIGVVSFGPSPCGMQGWPGVYTKVANYVPWIISKLRP